MKISPTGPDTEVLDKRLTRSRYRTEIERLEKARQQSEHDYEQAIQEIARRYKKIDRIIGYLLIFGLLLALLAVGILLSGYPERN